MFIFVKGSEVVLEVAIINDFCHYIFPQRVTVAKPFGCGMKSTLSGSSVVHLAYSGDHYMLLVRNDRAPVDISKGQTVKLVGGEPRKQVKCLVGVMSNEPSVWRAE